MFDVENFCDVEKSASIAFRRRESKGAVLSGDIIFPTHNTFVDLSKIVNNKFKVFGKIEFLNPAGSIKIKPAIGLLQELINDGRVDDETTIVETSSGNMGIALSMVCVSLGLRFICITDEKITPHNKRLIEAYGGSVVVMPASTHADRCKYIEDLEVSGDKFIWTRQFQNNVNIKTHEKTTASEIFKNISEVDYIFAGTGTGGTLSGCASYRDAHSPLTKIIAVDALGSRHFVDSTANVTRKIPGIGATERSKLLDGQRIDDFVLVSDVETIASCRRVLRETGWLVGGSSGSVLSAIIKYSSCIKDGEVVVCICSDAGERYLDTIYNDEWCRKNFEKL